MLPSVADIRAEIARQEIKKWKLAAEVDVHPSTFYGMLRGRIAMPSAVRERVSEALAARAQETAVAS